MTGFIGACNQIANAQEQAKDLISESVTIFEARKYKKKIAEAQTELALCYLRTGEYKNASEHKRYLSNVENNIGFLYLKINYCAEAHEHLNRARRIFTSLKDKVALAQVDETRARVFLREKRNAEAEKPRAHQCGL